VYGLNDPSSPNYIADLNTRIKVAAELQVTAANLGITAIDLLNTITQGETQ